MPAAYWLIHNQRNTSGIREVRKGTREWREVELRREIQRERSHTEGTTLPNHEQLFNTGINVKVILVYFHVAPIR